MEKILRTAKERAQWVKHTAKLVAALGQDESAKAILTNSASQPVPEDSAPETDD